MKIHEMKEQIHNEIVKFLKDNGFISIYVSIDVDITSYGMCYVSVYINALKVKFKSMYLKIENSVGEIVLNDNELKITIALAYEVNDDIAKIINDVVNQIKTIVKIILMIDIMSL
ncbi:hypothetical protein DRJ17_06395 [Candidatus Woesearchaeota archaeon]|nr:MAG: hypothetical protein DRJ17_06395 [Candidatus Woesearchaeota archaeon]